MKRIVALTIALSMVCTCVLIGARGSLAEERITALLYEQIPSYALVERLPEFEAETGIKVEY